MKRTLFLLLAMGGLLSCSGGGGEAASPADTLTRRQKDSIVSELPIPGSNAVGNAMRAVDSINARTQRHDTIR